MEPDRESALDTSLENAIEFPHEKSTNRSSVADIEKHDGATASYGIDMSVHILLSVVTARCSSFTFAGPAGVNHFSKYLKSNVPANPCVVAEHSKVGGRGPPALHENSDGKIHTYSVIRSIEVDPSYDDPYLSGDVAPVEPKDGKTTPLNDLCSLL